MGWGGQEIRIVAEMREFLARGYRIALACRPGSRISEEAARAALPVHEFGFRAALDPVTIGRLVRLIRRQSVALVNTHSSVDGWCGGIAGRLAGVKVVRSRHLSSEVRPGLNARIVYGRLPHAVISSGVHIRDHLASLTHGERARHFSVPAGADSARFHPEVDAAGVRREFALTPDDQVVGIVGVLRSWKGHRVLLEACASILSEFPRLKVLIVGEGPMRGQLVQAALQLGIAERTIFTGHRTDVPELMKAMSVCVLPSLKNEATSQVMPQAMLVGTPVICSSAGGLTEVVDHAVTGRVVPPGEVAALARALVQTWRSAQETSQMAQRARAHALAKLTFEGQIASTAAVYRDLLDPKGVQ